jgi:acetoin utilization deacetylase AcuC-like enzyme
MNSSVLAWVSHPDCLRHVIGPDHPESPQRLEAIQDRLAACGMASLFVQHPAPRATREQLARVHDAAHVDRLLALEGAAAHVPIDADTALGPHTIAAALRAAGAAVRGVDLVLEDRAQLAFCGVRPPGHHAERDRAMGFCFFNNVAVGAAHALARGLSRVAILDFDLHYGNGTADIFQGDPRVMLYSTYQHPLYPHWHGAPQAANLVDVPLPEQSGTTAFRAAVTTEWLPRLQQQSPELILVSAGFDAHRDDPLGDLRLVTEDYGWIGQVIHDAAAVCCEGRVVATLEGGYDLQALARSVEAFLGPFLGAEVPL